jgi:copper chaperone NosL
MKNLLRSAVLLSIFAMLGACTQETAQDLRPQDMTVETLGHYCQMNLLEHPGPKAQVFIEGFAAPLFFSQVRDAIAYVRAPEKLAPVLAIYVNDMGRKGATWDQPGNGNWLEAHAAYYVVGSARAGGMGAPETVPFGSRAAADAFALVEGGMVLALDGITDDMVLAPVEMDGGDDADFNERLHALHPGTGV